MADPTLTPQELRVLSRLRLNPKKAQVGAVTGERLTRRKGLSIEFADYREYAEGDDLRHLDWNVLARLGVPTIKTYADEEDLAVHLLLDASASMAFGEPSKFESAVRWAAAFGFVGSSAGDGVLPHALGKPAPPTPSLRGRPGVARLHEWLVRREPEGDRDLSDELSAFANSDRRLGLCVLISDGLHPDFAAAVRRLGARGHEPWVLQILSPPELDPDLEGDLRLVDAEGGAAVEITASRATLTDYKRRLEEHIAAISESARSVGGRYATVPSDQPMVDAIGGLLRKEGWFAA